MVVFNHNIVRICGSLQVILTIHATNITANECPSQTISVTEILANIRKVTISVAGAVDCGSGWNGLGIYLEELGGDVARCLVHVCERDTISINGSV
jgi:hypothetical protein